MDTATNEIVWEYRDNPPFNFFSAYISGARRLTNGNTLITEGQPGRIFQVNAVPGEVVWEYINPHFAPNEQGYVVNSVFPFHPLPAGADSAVALKRCVVPPHQIPVHPVHQCK